jgi:hypothetical protein
VTVSVAQPGTLDYRLGQLVRSKVRAWDEGRGRSRQRRLGASGLGHPCLRHLAYYATGAEQIGQKSDPFPAIMGTWGHAGLDEVFRGDPEMELGQNVEIGPDLYGTYDAYHRPSATVIDWKFLSKDSINRIRNHGPGNQYRVQVHAYAFGLYRLGVDVKNVALVCFPRSGFLVGVHVWAEPFDIDVVEQAFARWYGLVEMAPILKSMPAMFNALAMADGPCAWCSWFNPELSKTSPEKACPGFTRSIP